MYSHRSTCLGKQYTRALLTVTWHYHRRGQLICLCYVAMVRPASWPVIPLLLLLVEAVAFRPMGGAPRPLRAQLSRLLRSFRSWSLLARSHARFRIGPLL
jgi:hypothetical protein